MDKKQNFIKIFNELSKEVYEIAVSKGWYNNPRTEGEAIALIHSELSEALEGLRHGNPPDDKIPEFNSVDVELADVIIRILDMSYYGTYNVAEALVAKIEFNKNREYKHGGKKF